MMKSRSFCLLSTSQSVKGMTHALSDQARFFSTWHMLGYKHSYRSEEHCTFNAFHGHHMPSSFQLGILTFYSNSFQGNSL